MSDLTFSIVCKSYVPDFDRLLILFESIKKYNRDNIPFIVICPKSDFNQLTNKLGNCDFLTIMDDKKVKENFYIDKYKDIVINQ